MQFRFPKLTILANTFTRDIIWAPSIDLHPIRSVMSQQASSFTGSGDGFRTRSKSIPRSHSDRQRPKPSASSSNHNSVVLRKPQRGSNFALDGGTAGMIPVKPHPSPSPLQRKASYSAASPSPLRQNSSTAVQAQLRQLQLKQRGFVESQHASLNQISYPIRAPRDMMSGASSISSMTLSRDREAQQMGKPSSKLKNVSSVVEPTINLVGGDVPNQVVKSVAGNSIRGPTVIQMIFNYAFFLVVLAVAVQTNWSPYIRFYMVVIYIILSYEVLQIARISNSRNANSPYMFYYSLLPFVYFIFISREVHFLAFLLWYATFLIIYLQSGVPDVSKHVTIYSLFGLLSYGIAVLFMSLFYKSDCPFFVCGQPLVPPIDFRQELMAVAVAFALTINCRFLDYFIKLNAVALLDRDNFLKELFNMNVELLKQLRKEKETEIVDLESPLTKVLQILGEIRDSDAADSFMIKELDRIMKVLHSDQLYTPDIFQKSSDADVSEWLKMMMQQTPNAGGAGAGSGSISTVVRSGFEYEFIGGDGDARGSHVVTFSLTPDQQMSTQESRVFELLRDIDDPSFDVSVVESVSNGRVLFYVGYYLFLKYDMLRKHKIPESVFRNWLTRVEHGYRGTNPYHNAIHAADVAHSMNYYINKARIWTHISPEEQLASFIAAIIHDFMHPGVNNTFLINTNNPLALRYNDVAVLENFHCATIFEIMESNEDLNILRSLSIEAQKVVRETVVSAVLATDIAMHFDWIGKFKNKMGPTSGGINWDVKLDRRLVINMAIKCADVNNPTKPLEACKYWTEKIMEEFFRQGDEEKKRGVQVSMFMNRASTDIPKCQIGFIDFIVFPLFEVWSVFMQEDVQPQMQNIATNKQYWKDQGAIQ